MTGRTARIVLCAFAGLCASAPAAGAATIPVDSQSDALGGLGCSLRDAIESANNDASLSGCPAGSGADTIVLPAGRYVLTITGASEDLNATGDLDISSDVTIAGAGAGTTAVDGGGRDRVFDVHSGTVTISGVEVTGGRAPDGAAGSGGGSGGDGEGGGGIRNAGDLTLDHVTVDRNATGAGGAGDTATAGDAGFAHEGGEGGAGGGVLSTGTLRVSDSTIASNATGAGGRGGDAPDGASGATGQNSSGGFGGNGGPGGGVADQGAGATIVDSIVSGNRTGRGGAGGDAGAGGATSNDHQFGGSSFGGDGGQGGFGGGVALSGGGSGVTHSSVISNVTGPGGPGGVAGNGGNATGASSFGGSSDGGQGGHGGDGGGVLGGSVSNATLYGNATGGGAPGNDAGTPGTGAFVAGSSVGGGGGNGGEGAGAWGAILANVTAAANDATASGGAGGTAQPGGILTVHGSAGGSGIGGGVAHSTIANSILWGNSAGSDADCSSLNADDGTSSIGGPSCTNQSHADPGLGPLEDNGGPTPTMAPQGGDPGPAELGSSTCEPTDQRGVPRAAGDCDAGAYETGLSALTDAATGVTTTGATLTGAITPTLRSTSFHFDYGRTSGYGSSTPSATAAPGAESVPVSTALSGLAPNTTYHYRVVAGGPDGDSTGSDQTFKTAAAPAQSQSQSQPTVAGDSKPPSSPVLERAFVIDTGAAVARIGRRFTFRMPGLRFVCPKTASGLCALRVAVTSRHHGSTASLLVKRAHVGPGRTLALELRATRALRTALGAHHLMRLRATVTFAAPGTPSVTVRKLFVLLAPR